eukprot:TRINITY_DN2144_c0_g1_i1.p1 TRINITY_DN2144_c0_g1~~TRINITY_DN2144_c0_g1_i1.p1  ORF type:complete len:204 (+),score=48.25 TRINITY_DN2144_c0_g1_i1:58-669(+)
MSEEDPKIFKIIVVGDSGVGKTCLIKQFTQHIFYESNQSTISTDLGMRDEIINGKPTKLHIWDTAGQEQYRSIVTAYYRNSYGAIIVFDMTRRDSFQNANTWLQELKKHAGDQVRVILVGNKADCEYMRAVTTKEAEEYAEYYNLLYYETSAKTSLNVDKMFLTLSEDIWKNIEEFTSETVDEKNDLLQYNKSYAEESSSGCC